MEPDDDRREGLAVADREPSDAMRPPEEGTEAALRALIAQRLPGTEILLVSNREPRVHTATPEGVACNVPTGGLVAALEPIARSCGGTWIAHGSGSADRETVDADDRLRVPADDPRYTLRRVWLTPEEERGYYLGYSNEALWPLCHNAFVRPVFRDADWAHYVAVNRRFAEAVVTEAKSAAPVVIVQDYHFALLPRMIRERLPDATIVHFWHIPWPNAEIFGICPNASVILDGLLGADIIGFQTPLHRINFVDCVERTIESRTDREDWSVHYGGAISRVRTYPISIAWPEAAPPDPPPPPEGLTPPRGGRLVLSVGRLDYTKGIPESLRAVDLLLTNRPELAGRMRYFCVAAPTRGGLKTYRDLRRTCRRMAAEVNERHGTRENPVVVFADRAFSKAELDVCYRAADVCIVPSLHDGMNLIAKEYVSQRGEDDGVLVLSKFAGAMQELPEALQINPFDIGLTADTLGNALEMPRRQQRVRMRRMRESVRHNSIFRWAERLLSDAAHYRGRNRIDALTPTRRHRPEHPPDDVTDADTPRS
jgi:trehalose 6-phosphate synthase